ncbi:MAG: amidohydrolase family protein, partial [Anaerolineales bacterium]|nr:amidohydrolase family protein [Anaerolineales bacterium]
MDTVIRNGAVVTPQATFIADVGITGEQVEAVGTRLHAPVELDATGCYVLPGAVDPHVHLQMPLGPHRSSDTFSSGTIAAALGGTTTVIDFVEPAQDMRFHHALEARCQEADGAVAVDYGLHMTVPTWHADRGEELESLRDVVTDGVPSFKLYMAYAGLRLDDRQLYRVMQAIAGAGGLAVVHAENGPLCDELRAQALSQGHTAPCYHALTRPPRQEAEAAGRAMDIAALAGCPLYVVHVSCRESLERVAAARARGDRVAAETCPQYLLLDQSALSGDMAERMVCAPPLRPIEHQATLWNGLAHDVLDVLATDHCPFMQADKRDHSNFTTIPGGLPSIEARLSLAYTYG